MKWTYAIPALVLAVCIGWSGRGPVVVERSETLAPVGKSVESASEFRGVRSKLNAELDRRAALPAGHADKITAAECERAKKFVGRLGDGRILDFIIKYGPDIIRIVGAILALLAFL